MFTVKIKTGGAAFDDGYKNYELARILRKIAEALEEGRVHGKCMDLNGNGVGEWKDDD